MSEYNMRTESDIQSDIENLRILVNSATVSHSEDGVSNTFSLSAAQKQLAELENELAALQGTTPKRPRFIQIKLS